MGPFLVPKIGTKSDTKIGTNNVKNTLKIGGQIWPAGRENPPKLGRKNLAGRTGKNGTKNVPKN